MGFLQRVRKKLGVGGETFTIGANTYRGVFRVLDTGHGAKRGHGHTGACANGLIEDEVAFDMVRRIGHHLRASGCDTVLTRPGAENVGIVERARAARYAGADLFLSIHCNAGPPKANGAEAFVAEGDERSRRLAHRILEAAVKRGLRNRGVKWDSQSQHSRLGVLRGTYRRMPAVLLELGFLTSPHDSMLLKDRLFRETLAISVADALRQITP